MSNTKPEERYFLFSVVLRILIPSYFFSIAIKSFLVQLPDESSHEEQKKNVENNRILMLRVPISIFKLNHSCLAWVVLSPKRYITRLPHAFSVGSDIIPLNERAKVSCWCWKTCYLEPFPALPMELFFHLLLRVLQYVKKICKLGIFAYVPTSHTQPETLRLFGTLSLPLEEQKKNSRNSLVPSLHINHQQQNESSIGTKTVNRNLVEDFAIFNLQSAGVLFDFW